MAVGGAQNSGTTPATNSICCCAKRRARTVDNINITEVPANSTSIQKFKRTVCWREYSTSASNEPAWLFTTSSQARSSVPPRLPPISASGTPGGAHTKGFGARAETTGGRGGPFSPRRQAAAEQGNARV